MANHKVFSNKSNVNTPTQNATKALIENLAPIPVEQETENSKNKKQEDVLDISSYLDKVDTTKTDTNDDTKDDIKAIKDSEEVFDALLEQTPEELEQTPEEQKIILDNANNSDQTNSDQTNSDQTNSDQTNSGQTNSGQTNSGQTNSDQELAKNNFTVIDPSDKEEIVKKQKTDNLVLDYEPKNIKSNDILTKSIEGVVGHSKINDDVDVGYVGADAVDAIEAENDNSDNAVDIDVNDIEKKQKNTPVSDGSDTIASSIDDIIIDNRNKDASTSLPDTINQVIGDKLSLPPELFDVSNLNSNPTKEAGIIPIDMIMGIRQTKNKNIYTIDNKPVQQPTEPQRIPTPLKAINLEKQDFKCYFKHFINMAEKAEVFKLTLTPELQTQPPIKMQVKKKLQLYQYLNMSLENVDNYPSEFAVLKNFCKTITVEKSVSEDY